LWPNESAYGYAEWRPSYTTDSTGFQSQCTPPYLRGDSVSIPIYPRPNNPMEKPPKTYCLPYPYLDQRPLQWGYGNWCGQGRGYDNNKVTAKCASTPPHVDRLDACCHEHDDNLGKSAFHGNRGFAHCKLVRCALAVDCSKSPTPRACEIARAELVSLMIQFCSIEVYAL